MEQQDQAFDAGPHALELRVLSGPQAGARAPLPTAEVCLLATGADADDADIALRDDGAAPVRIRIAASAGMAMLDVLAGPVMLGDETLAPGESHAWAMHAPLRVGSSTVAFGLASVEDWSAAPAAAAAEGAPAAAASPARAPKRRAASWVVAACLLAGVASVAAIGVVQYASPSQAAGGGPKTPLAQQLRDSEFAHLEVAQDAAGRPELRGRLTTVAQRTQLDAWLAARGQQPVVNVTVDEALARDVTDVFRVNGVAVTAKVQRAGQVVAEAAEPDHARLARAEDVVRRDVRGLTGLKVVNTASPPPPPPPPPMPDDPGKRIASVVPGEPAYLVTVDGARYFVGAMLPSGHRIKAIAGQRVSLERDGQSTTLNL
jgi:type III secretion protein D